MTKIITVVTPSYNQGQFIEQTIQSVLSQEGDFFIDYIIMDGGSKDHSVEIIKKYEDLLIKNCDLIELEGNRYFVKKKGLEDFLWLRCRGIAYRWCSQPDDGQTAAINKGFRLAQGQVLAWINSDDMYFPQAFRQVIDFFDRHSQADFVHGDGDVIDENNSVQWEWLSRPYDWKVLTSYHYLWNDFTNYIMQQATFWRRPVLDRIGYPDESFAYAMDVEYWVRAGARGLQFYHFPVKLGKFRMIGGTKSLSSPTVFWHDMLEIYRRHNGARRMASFFAYYFYNIALHNGCDMQQVRQAQNALFAAQRWQKLSAQERGILAKKAERGYWKASFLTANRAFYTDNRQRAKNIFRSVIRHNCLLIFHPLSIIFLCKCLLRRKAARVLQKLKKALISWYRQRRFDYRYLEKKRAISAVK